MKRILLAFTALMITSTAGAAPKSKSGTAAALDAKVANVQDRRSARFSGLTVTLELPGILDSQFAASRVLLRRAVDDTGKSLLPESSEEPQLATNARTALGITDSKASPATIGVSLESPERRAQTLTEVAGEIELYMPSKDPNSVAVIPKFLSMQGKTLSHKALKANGVEITLVSQAQLEAEKKRQAEIKRKEAEAEGFPAEMIEEMVTQFVSMFFGPQENDVVLRVKDPKKLIHEFSYVDGAGETKRVMPTDQEGLTVLSGWEKPQADWKLKVSMKTAKTLVRHSFAVRNVQLP